jgi:hypothetical protein
VFHLLEGIVHGVARHARGRRAVAKVAHGNHFSDLNTPHTFEADELKDLSGHGPRQITPAREFNNRGDGRRDRLRPRRLMFERFSAKG